MSDLLVYGFLFLFIFLCIGYLCKEKIFNYIEKKILARLELAILNCKDWITLYKSVDLETFHPTKTVIIDMNSKHFIMSESGKVKLTLEGKKELELLETELESFESYKRLLTLYKK